MFRASYLALAPGAVRQMECLNFLWLPLNEQERRELYACPP